jgi:hypothetical protein
MSPAVIDRVTAAVDEVHTVSFTGGEPSLGSKAIRHFRWSAYYNHCATDEFWLTVNARFFKQDFYDALLDLYAVCNLREECVLTISGDQYHGKMSGKALEKYSELPFFSDYWLNRRIEDDHLLNEGMARRNGFGRREVPDVRISISDYDLVGETLYVGDMVYINAKGDVLLCCDLSYTNQKWYAIGNVLTEPFEQILRRCLNIKAT